MKTTKLKLLKTLKYLKNYEKYWAKFRWMSFQRIDLLTLVQFCSKLFLRKHWFIVVFKLKIIIHSTVQSKPVAHVNIFLIALGSQ